jgi:hypothetical protein
MAKSVELGAYRSCRRGDGNGTRCRPGTYNSLTQTRHCNAPGFQPSRARSATNPALAGLEFDPLAVNATKVVHPKRAWETGGCRPSVTQAEASDGIRRNWTLPYAGCPIHQTRIAMGVLAEVRSRGDVE